MMLRRIPPTNPTRIPAPFDHEDWVFELKQSWTDAKVESAHHASLECALLGVADLEMYPHIPPRFDPGRDAIFFAAGTENFYVVVVLPSDPCVGTDANICGKHLFLPITKPVTRQLIELGAKHRALCNYKKKGRFEVWPRSARGCGGPI
jgi:hypothetical protein